MELLSMYQKCTMNIDEIKGEELQRGLTTKCKRAIDEGYSKISGKEGELEHELYKRKSCLLNDIKVNSNLKYDMMMSVVGAFLGTVIGHLFQEILQTFIVVSESIKKSALQGLDPVEIISDGMFDWGVMFLVGAIIVYFVWIHRDDIHKNDELYVFQTDMGNYEMQRIDELLEKL